ncbi:glucosaminidase domain-containing protein [Paenibacillus sp. OV219]|uniref:glucosaminidase domain-containing protein n=1 Tax=Paenibacillus sp. OV219 TaxID=1884377 RepID=UPI0008BA7970|nr:glucosaminidase domain-containing protein [Paenibacillus sp. OV219]SEM90380.1 SH3 domain-containing protein [Paenibacillus sp. OV219]
MSRSIQWNVVAYMIIAALLASFVLSFNHTFSLWSSRSADNILTQKFTSNKQIMIERLTSSSIISKSAFQPVTVVKKATPTSAISAPIAATEKKKPVAIASAKPLYTYKVTSFYLNVRSEPNADAKIMYEVKQGTQLQVLSKDDAGWLMLKSGGYVHGGYATVIGMKQAPAEVTIQSAESAVSTVSTVSAVSAVSSAVTSAKVLQNKSLQVDVRPKVHTMDVKVSPIEDQVATVDTSIAEDDNGNPVKPTSRVNTDSGLSSKQIAQLLNGTKLSGQGLEQAVLSIEEEYGINAFFTIAVMKLESGNGKSRLARTKNNLFGLNATSSNPYRKATYFETKGDCVQKFGQLLSDNYVERGYTTIEKVARKYCPVNSKWASHVRSIMRSDFSKLA